MSQLSVSSLSVRFDEVVALAEASFEVARGEFFCIVGPTNAGKSTLLKTIAGLVRPDGGTVAINGKDVTAAEPRDRQVSLLFQNIALFPTLTGFENMAFALRTAGVPAPEIEERVRALAAILKVGHVLDRLPRTFSGGEQQRVAIGRAIARPAEVLLLDEPLTNLDARIRISLRVQFKEIHQQSGQTIVYVTHDQIEAMSLSDRIGVLHEGRFQQIGTPDEVYRRPVNRFVAEFIGQQPMNVLPATPKRHADVSGVEVEGAFFAVPGLDRLAASSKLPEALAIGVRPERVRVAGSQSARTPNAGEVIWVEHLGSRSVVDLRFGKLTLKATLASDTELQPHSKAWFDFEPAVEHLLDAGTGEFIR